MPAGLRQRSAAPDEPWLVLPHAANVKTVSTTNPTAAAPDLRMSRRMFVLAPRSDPNDRTRAPRRSNARTGLGPERIALGAIGRCTSTVDSRRARNSACPERGAEKGEHVSREPSREADDARDVVLRAVHGVARLDHRERRAADASARDLHTRCVGAAVGVADAFTLALATCVLSGGTLGDRFGRKRMFLVGLTIFTVGSFLCGIAPSIGALIGSRALQGVGAAILLPSTLAILAPTFPDTPRACDGDRYLGGRVRNCAGSRAVDRRLARQLG